MTAKIRGRPRSHRPRITADGTTWEVNKIIADIQSGGKRLLKIEATAWIAEGDFPDLHNFVAEYRRKQAQRKGKTKNMVGVKRRKHNMALRGVSDTTWRVPELATYSFMRGCMLFIRCNKGSRHNRLYVILTSTNVLALLLIFRLANNEFELSNSS